VKSEKYDLRFTILALGIWNLELGIWNLEFGTWYLEFGTLPHIIHINSRMFCFIESKNSIGYRLIGYKFIDDI
jgi:hypothetical protein